MEGAVGTVFRSPSSVGFDIATLSKDARMLTVRIHTQLAPARPSQAGDLFVATAG